MSLESPNLDTRTYKDLVKEARARIPRYTPEWTNLNDSDPGMALVKLNAWLTETLLYQLNRLPELNYIKFLELLNVKPVPATAATTELTFKLKKLSARTDPLQVLIPKNAQVAVDDPDLTQEVVFETSYTLNAINAAIGAIIVHSDNSQYGQSLQLITEYNAKDASLKVLHAFYPFGSEPAAGDTFLIGVLLRPFRKDGVDEDYYSQDVFPSGQLDLAVNATQVFDADDQGEIIEGPFAEQSRFPWEMAEQSNRLEWEIYAGTDHAKEFLDTTGNQNSWRRLNVSDETSGLQENGHVRLEIPENISSVSLHQLPRSFWESLGLKKPPVTIDELIDDLKNAELNITADSLDEKAWKKIGLPESEWPKLMACCTTVSEAVSYLNTLKANISLDPSNIPFEDWIELDAGYDDPAVTAYAMAWLRVRVANTPVNPRLLNTFLLNTVPAMAAVTRLEEQLGSSDGRPAQKFSLKRLPVYYDPVSEEPDLLLEVLESGESKPWQRVNDFYRQKSDSEVYILDETTGTITFGDGVYGRIPVAGARIIARRYRYGGGKQSNVGENTVTKLKSVLPFVESVSNLLRAEGGQDAESLTETKLRAGHELKSQDRAVSAEDFAMLAKQTPGVAIQRAYALSRRKVDEHQTIVEADGAVTLVLLPLNDENTPQPDAAQLKAVCEYMNPRRLITTELYVTGPTYQTIKTLSAEIRAESDADLKALTEAAFADLLGYFHPLYGGEEGNGWPFGDDIYFGNVYRRLLMLAGTRRVVSLHIVMEGEGDTACRDTITIPEGQLVHLPRSAIDLKVVYDSYR